MKTLLHILFGLALAWLIVSAVIFQFRHPWATETERFLHLPDAILLRKIPHQQMRP